MDIITLNKNLERFRRQRRRQRQGEKNETCKIITAVERELARTPDYHNYRFYRANRCDSEEKKSTFRKASRQILKKGERLLKKILQKDPTNTDIFSEVNKLDMQVRWSLNKRQRRRQRQGEKNETCKIITAVERELARTPDYHNYRFYRANRCDSEEKVCIQESFKTNFKERREIAKENTTKGPD